MRALTILTAALCVLPRACGDDVAPAAGPYARWANGPPADPAFFPICVWLQAPANAAKFKELGFNTYMGLWKGPTDEQLTGLKKAGMFAICEQNAVGLKWKDDKTILAWMHGDEPDNAQWDAGQKKYTGAVPLERLLAGYRRMAAADPTRPILVNFGQGVANDGWIGIGMKRDRYPAYMAAADIVSFDVYPVVGVRKPDGENYLWWVAKGVDRLREWTGDKKPVWNVIECTHIGEPTKKATPAQVRAMVWMSLVHGSRGLCYFVHQFKPKFIEAALLVDGPMCKEVRVINTRIHELAPVLNSPTLADAATVASSDPKVPIDLMAKKHDQALYIFAVGMRNAATRGTFTVAGLKSLSEGPSVGPRSSETAAGKADEGGDSMERIADRGERSQRPSQPTEARRVFRIGSVGAATAEVLGEGRTVALRDGRFADDFAAYDVHLYRIQLKE